MERLMLTKVSKLAQTTGAALCVRCYSSRYDAEPFMRRDVRKKDALARNPNHSRHLLNTPDYTYLDGRATPYGSRQLARMEKQREYTEKIIKLTREVDMAKSTHRRHLIEKEQEIKQIIDSKLKPKGSKHIDE